MRPDSSLQSFEREARKALLLEHSEHARLALAQRTELLAGCRSQCPRFPSRAGPFISSAEQIGCARSADAHQTLMTEPGGLLKCRGDSGVRATEGSRSEYWLAACNVGIVLYALLDALVQSLPPHYSPISQAESDLAVGPYGYVMDVNFVIRGALTLAFIFACSRALQPRPACKRGYYLLGVWGVGSIILAFFPTDVGGPPTLQGTVHLVVALLAFLGGAFGELSLSRGLGQEAWSAGKGKYLSGVAVLAVIALAVLFLGPGVAPRAFVQAGGLVERVFIGLVLLWILLASATLMKWAKKSSS